MIEKEKLDKLPKWAREHITDLQRQRDTAVGHLSRWVDDQTPAPFYSDDHICTGEELGPTAKRRYFQGHRIGVEHAGIGLDIILKDDCIQLQWSREKHWHVREVAFIPASFQAAYLKVLDGGTK